MTDIITAMRDPDLFGPWFAGPSWASFRTDVGSFLDRDMIEAAIEAGRTVRPPIEGVRYRAFCDPGGGVGDALTRGIAHRDDASVVLDCLFERRPPFSPPGVVSEIAALLKSYGLTSATGDRYAAQWVVSAFKENGIEYRHNTRDHSEIYLDALPPFTSGQVSLLDIRRLVTELAGLERRTRPGGRDRVDHGTAPGSHDDLANSACGALVLAARRVAQRAVIALPFVHSVPRGFAGGMVGGFDDPEYASGREYQH